MTGCSRGQLEEEATGKCKLPSMWEAADGRFSPQAQPADGKVKETEKEEVTWQEFRGEWLALIRSAWVEVLLGAALSSIFSYGTQLAGNIHQQLPTSPTAAVGSVRRFSSHAMDAANRSAPTARKLVIRTVIYSAFFLTVYSYRALQRVRLPPGFPF